MIQQPTSYEQFTLAQVRQVFSLTLDEQTDWTSEAQPIEPSPRLQQDLADNVLPALATNTEKARSELIITPILLEVRRRTSVTIFSGKTFNVAEELGLKGRCDFIISASSELYYIEAPVLTIVEAKNESIVSGLGQCLATMVAAQMFNQGGVVYGAVTTGDRWKFLKLVDQTAYIAPGEITLDRLGVVLGVLINTVIAANKEIQEK
jgi:hypothetical protein